ncbi:hypothetical protein [Dyella sp. ASV21]|uniref:hypothetical protein n=1 Tax=Dyella sp. ASV21 TaxID=2795114 RepID=UPI0018EAF65F|nr:hypothetical protein [Dyella sp. ASV21]
MSDKTIWAALLYCLSMTACAKQQDVIHAIDIEYSFDACHFRLKDPYHGRTTGPNGAAYFANISPKAEHRYETWIQFSCQNPATAKTYSDRAGMQMTPKGWTIDPSPDNLGIKEQHTTFYPLHGQGWEGGGVTQDDINGDEDRRSRSFNFCIPHGQLALCGSVQTVTYLKWPKETTLPQVIKLLESIEFIDTPTPASSSSSP